jgi:hypothetical protein
MSKKKKTDVAEPQVESEVVEEQAAQPVGAKKAQPVGAKKAQVSRDDEEVIIDITHPVRINGVRYYGKTKLPRHMAESIAEIVQKKQRADLEVFTGRNYTQKFLPNGDRIIMPAIEKKEE